MRAGQPAHRAGNVRRGSPDRPPGRFLLRRQRPHLPRDARAARRGQTARPAVAARPAKAGRRVRRRGRRRLSGRAGAGRADGGQRGELCPHRSGQGHAARRHPGKHGDSERGLRLGAGAAGDAQPGRREDLRHPRRPLVRRRGGHARVDAGGLPADRCPAAGRSRRPGDWLFGPGCHDRRPARRRAGDPGRPSLDGQDGPGPEHRRLRGRRAASLHSGRVAGNVAARAGPADALLAGRDQGHEVPQRHADDRRQEGADGGLGRAEPGAALRGRHAEPAT